MSRVAREGYRFANSCDSLEAVVLSASVENKRYAREAFSHITLFLTSTSVLRLDRNVDIARDAKSDANMALGQHIALSELSVHQQQSLKRWKA